MIGTLIHNTFKARGDLPSLNVLQKQSDTEYTFSQKQFLSQSKPASFIKLLSLIKSVITCVLYTLGVLAFKVILSV